MGRVPARSSPLGKDLLFNPRFDMVIAHASARAYSAERRARVYYMARTPLGDEDYNSTAGVFGGQTISGRDHAAEGRSLSLA